MTNRKVIVCQRCHRRKVKCNKEFPCNHCTKNNEDCIYDREVLLGHLKFLQSKVETLEHKLNVDFNTIDPSNSNSNNSSSNPQSESPDTSPDDVLNFNIDIGYGDTSDNVNFEDLNLKSFFYLDVDGDDEIINFFENYNPFCTNSKDFTRNFYGPLNVISIYKVDPILNALHEAFPQELKLNKPYNVPDDIQGEKSRLNKQNNNQGVLFFQENIGLNLQLINKAQLTLPRRGLLWSILDFYFKGFHVFSPLVDRSSFIANLERILGPDKVSDTYFTHLNIEDKIDFAYIGILLIFLRLTYITLVFGNTSGTKMGSPFLRRQFPLTECLINEPIGLESINVAQECLNQFNLLGPINLTIFQLTIYLRTYQMIGPEFGDGLNDHESQMLTTILVRMALSLGLHLDPPKTASSDQICILRRLWSQTLYIDKNSSMVSGDPFNVQVNTTINFPEISFDPNDPSKIVYPNNNLSEIDRVFISQLGGRHRGNSAAMRRFNDSFLAINDGLSVKTAIEIVRNLVVARKDDYIFFGVSMQQNTELSRFYYKVTQIKFWYVYNNTMLSALIHIYNFYLNKALYDKANKYLRYIFMLIFKNILPFVDAHISGTQTTYGGDFNVHLTPSLLNITHKVILILLSLKLKSTLAESIPGITLPTLCNFQKQLDHSLDIFIPCVKLLSSKYYYAWKIMKLVHSYDAVISKINVHEFYKNSFDKVNLNDYIVSSLTDIITSSFNNIELTKLFGLLESNGTVDNSDTLWNLVMTLRNEINGTFTS